MDRTEISPEVIAELAPFLSAPRALEAAERAGVKLPAGLVERAREAKTGKPFPPELVDSLAAEFGPAPPVRVSVQPRTVAALSASGYALVASTDLSVLGDVLSELWRVGTIPHQLSKHLTDELLSVAELEANCSNVPAGGEPGLLELSSPPAVSASTVTNANLHLDLAFRLPVLIDGQEAAALTGAFGLEVLLEFEVVGVGVVQLSQAVIQTLTGTLTIDGSSTIRPQSEAARATLESLIVPRLRTALLFLLPTLSFQAAIPIQKSRYPNSVLRVVQVGAVTLREGGRDFAIVGVNVQNSRPVDQLALTAVPLPGPDLNLHAVVDEQFASDALSTVITSGDLAAFFNRVLARHSHGLKLAEVVIDGGRIDFQDERLLVSIDCTMVDACEFKKDLGFTATVTGTPAVANGTLAIDNSDVDIDLDNVDAFLCTILNSILGPLGTVATIAVESFIAAYNPSTSDVDIPVSETSTPLPGSDKVIDVELTDATMTPGVLTAEGRLRLIADPEHVFAYLRVVEKLGPVLTFPLAGATVELYELDNPAPAGDDVAVPEAGETDVFTKKFETTTVIQYEPLPDQLLGTQTADENGNVTFIVTSNKIGGIETKTTTKTDIQTDQIISTRTEHLPIREPGPDLAVTIRATTGEVLAQRRLIGLNVASRRLGTFDHRVEVPVPPPQPPVASGTNP
jgi:hypothetical protein